MPTYVYKFVDTGETIEVQQGFHDDNLTEIAHPDSGAVLPVKKVFTPVGVTFKGSGFFKTDNRGAKPSASSASATSDSKTGGSSGADSGSSSSESSSSTTKSDSSGASKSGSGSTSTSGSSSSSDS